MTRRSIVEKILVGVLLPTPFPGIAFPPMHFKKDACEHHMAYTFY